MIVYSIAYPAMDCNYYKVKFVGLLDLYLEEDLTNAH